MMSRSANNIVVSPSRWCPTPEQVMILEEIYRNGLKTPNATQIQHITSHLSLYGKIEGKNVFYWFQNHKARDRQKLRRKLYKHFQQQHHQFLMKRHRFDCDNNNSYDHHQFVQYFLHHHHHQMQQRVPLPTACFHQNDSEEGSTTMVESGERAWYGGDDGMTMAGNGVEDDQAETTSRSGSLRTLELFPVKSSSVKEEESGSGNGGWGN